MDLANSSIWDGATGFGGDGDINTPVTVGEGRCVTDGPFTQLRPILYNHTYMDHCLSRGFRDNETIGRLSGRPFSPEAIGRIIRKPTYEEFEKDVEHYLHNTMHTAIAGDFLALTAANGKSYSAHPLIFF
jgi:tyrosinase